MIAMICLTRKVVFKPVAVRFVRKIMESANMILTRMKDSDKAAMVCSEFVYRSFNEAASNGKNPYAIVIKRNYKKKVSAAMDPFSMGVDLSDRIQKMTTEVDRPSYQERFLPPQESVSDKSGNTEVNYAELEAMFLEIEEEGKLDERSFIDQGRGFEGFPDRLSMALPFQRKRVKSLNEVSASGVIGEYLKYHKELITPGDLFARTKNLKKIGGLSI